MTTPRAFAAIFFSSFLAVAACDDDYGPGEEAEAAAELQQDSFAAGTAIPPPHPGDVGEGPAGDYAVEDPQEEEVGPREELPVISSPDTAAVAPPRSGADAPPVRQPSRP